MNINLKPHLLISHLLPGCFFLLLSLLAYSHWDFGIVKNSLKDINATMLIGLGIILLVAAFLLGEIFDSTRDGVIEWAFNKINKVNWDYFYLQDKNEKLSRLEDYYYTWYVFNLNTAISLISGGIVTCSYMGWKSLSWEQILFWFFSVVVLIIDALVLRKDLSKHTKHL